LEVILPHVIGGHPWSYQSRMPMWDEISENCELVVAFGGLALKNSQINPGGLARHQTQNLQRQCREAGVRFVNVSAADRPCSRLSQGPSALSALVDVELYGDSLPDVLAFTPPNLEH
jgi:hypothetical protein